MSEGRQTSGADPRSLRALDMVNFLVADVQTGFGPFIAIYLTRHQWTDLAIGSVLSLGTFAAMASQLPAGALVDWMANKRTAARLALLALMLSAGLLIAIPTAGGVGLAEILHGFASCMLSPAVAAITITLVGRAALGERLGRNARFSSIGAAIAAAVMGACGYYLAPASVFWLTALLCCPAMVALSRIRPGAARGFAAGEPGSKISLWPGLAALALDKRLLAFMGCIMLFQVADSAMLPFVGTEIAGRSGSVANLVVAACLVGPQIIVATIAPWIGRTAQTRGRRFVLLLGFAAEPLRGLLFATTGAPVPVVLIQGLNGISAAAIGVSLPLVAADIARERGHFNLTIGAIGLAVGLGATISNALAGAMASAAGPKFAFLALAGAGVVGTAMVWLIMPETGPDQSVPGTLSPQRRAAE